MRAYLINLARRPDRLHKMTRQLGDLGIRYQRIDAVDAQSTSCTAVAEQFSDSGPLGVIPKGDKCCALSHVRAWRAFVETGESHGLILEDDVIFDPDAAALLRDDRWIPAGVELLKLEHYGPLGQRVLIGQPIRLKDGRTLGRLQSRHAGAAAYIISRRTAEILLSQTGRWTLSVDHMLFNPNNSPLARTLQPYQMTPAVARQSADLGGCSDIGEWRAPLRQFNWTYVKRELVRAYFELRLLPRQIFSVIRRDTTLVRVGARHPQIEMGVASIGQAHPAVRPSLYAFFE